jgi:hypothetical protein
MAMGFFTLLTGILAHLALLDIFHLEPDGTLEWSILQGCGLIFLIFIGLALFTLRRSLKAIPA